MINKPNLEAIRELIALGDKAATGHQSYDGEYPARVGNVARCPFANARENAFFIQSCYNNRDNIKALVAYVEELEEKLKSYHNMRHSYEAMLGEHDNDLFEENAKLRHALQNFVNGVQIGAITSDWDETMENAMHKALKALGGKE